MASRTDASAIDDEVRRLYEQYLATKSDAERREFALAIKKFDASRHADIYDALEDK